MAPPPVPLRVTRQGPRYLPRERLSPAMSVPLRCQAGWAGKGNPALTQVDTSCRLIGSPVGGSHCYSLPFVDEEVGTQRGEEGCPRPHSSEMRDSRPCLSAVASCRTRPVCFPTAVTTCRRVPLMLVVYFPLSFLNPALSWPLEPPFPSASAG